MVVRRSLSRFRRLPPPAAPPPTTSPSLSPSLSPAQPLFLSRFLSRHLKPQFSPSDLLHFFQKKLRHHPSLSAYDLAVFRWATAVDSFRHDHSTFEWIIRCLSNTNRIDDLPQILDFMTSNPCPCNDGIFACARIEPIYSIAMNSFIRAGRIDQAEKLLQDLKGLIDGKPGISTYNLLMSGFCKIRRHDKVLEIYDRIRGDRVKPDQITFNILIQSGGIDSAGEVFKEMKDRGFEPNSVTFNILIGGFIRLGKVREGITVAREMVELGHVMTARTCEMLMRGFCRKGRVLEAWELVMEFRREGVLPEDFDCLNLVEGLCKDGEMEKAMELVKSLPRPGEVACAAVIEELRRLGRVDDAIVVAERTMEGGLAPDAITMNGLLREMCRQGRAAEAERMMAAARERGFVPDRSTYEVVVEGFAKEGRRKEAERLVDEMVDEGFIGDIHDYNRVMKMMDCGRRPHIVSLKQNMIR